MAVVFNLGLLFVFKYLTFSGGIINQLFGLQLSIPNIALPIGISFFTFQASFIFVMLEIWMDSLAIKLI